MTTLRPIHQVTVLSARHQPTGAPDGVDRTVLDVRQEVLSGLKAFLPGIDIKQHASRVRKNSRK